MDVVPRRERPSPVRPPLPPAMSSTSSQGVVDRVQAFVSEHKHAVLLATAAAVVAVGGVAYYASTSRGPDGDVEKGEGKKDKKKSKKRKTVKDDDGPILEERKPKPTTVVAEEGACFTCLADGTFGSPRAYTTCRG